VAIYKYIDMPESQAQVAYQSQAGVD